MNMGISIYFALSRISKRFVLVVALIFAFRLAIQVLVVVRFFRVAWSGVPTGLFFSTSGDTPGYIEPWINLIEKGTYSMDGVNPYADRMPFTGIFFALYYLITRDRLLSMNLSAVTQILIGCIGIYFTYLLTLDISNAIFRNNKLSQRLSLIYLIIATVSLHTLHFDGAILPDGPATAFLSIFLYYYHRPLQSCSSHEMADMLRAGTFLGLAVLLRPYYVLLYPLIIGEYLWRRGIHLFRGAIKRAFIFLAPILVLDAPWIIRNLIAFGKLIPFQTDIYAGSCDVLCQEYRNFAKMAGSVWHAYFHSGTLACYLESPDTTSCTFRFPSYMLGKKLNIQEINKLRLLCLRYKQTYCGDIPMAYCQNPKAIQRGPTLRDTLMQKFRELRSYYEEDHPYTYWLYPRLIALKEYLVHTGTFYAPPFHIGMQKFSPILFLSVKASQALLYWFALIGGLIGTIYLFLAKRHTYMLFSLPALLIALFPIYLITTETRYFYGAYPALLIGAVVMLGKIWSSFWYSEERPGGA